MEEEEGVERGGEEVPGLVLLLHEAAGQEGEGVERCAGCQAHLQPARRVSVALKQRMCGSMTAHLFIYWRLIAQSDRTGSPQGFSLN